MWSEVWGIWSPPQLPSLGELLGWGRRVKFLLLHLYFKSHLLHNAADYSSRLIQIGWASQDFWLLRQKRVGLVGTLEGDSCSTEDAARSELLRIWPSQSPSSPKRRKWKGIPSGLCCMIGDLAVPRGDFETGNVSQSNLP